MKPHRLTSLLILALIFTTSITNASAQKQKAPPGGRIGVVVDERLSTLRATPDLRGKLIRRIARGRLVAIRKLKVNRDGVAFYLVNVSSRTFGWIQREAVASTSQQGADLVLLTLIEASHDFDRIVRARIFLNHFPRSRLRPKVLLILGDAAEESSGKLSRDASRRLTENTAAPEFTYLMNYSGLDRYNRQGVSFLFDAKSRRFHYDGSSWRELVRRYPSLPEADVARRRLITLSQTFPSGLILTK
jgi:hypothetical protein